MTWHGLQAQIMDQALTVKDIALVRQVDEMTVYRLTKKGELPGFKVAGSWRFKQADMDAWVERQKVVFLASAKGLMTAKTMERD